MLDRPTASAIRKGVTEALGLHNTMQQRAADPCSFRPELDGDLAAIVAFGGGAAVNKNGAVPGEAEPLLSMAAGTRSHRYRTRHGGIARSKSG